MRLTFDCLVNEVLSPNSDVPKEIKGMFKYAHENGSKEDQDQFMDWLEDEYVISSVYSCNTEPCDWFECCQDMTWEDLEVYLEN